MLKFLFFIPVGIFSHCLLPTLPAAVWFVLLLFVSTLASLALPRLYCVPGLFFVGLALGGLWANQQMLHRLPETLDKTDLTVTGRISSLSITRGERTSFDFTIDQILEPPADLPDLRKLRLTWYGDMPPGPGEVWQLNVRLRSPRGFSNPGSFDYSGWLLSEGISATGYVRDSAANRRMGISSFSLSHIRQRILENILRRQGIDAGVQGIIAALVLGEKGLITADRFLQLKQTGTVHLVVVSGLHIGMVTGLCLLIGTVMGRIAVGLGAVYPARLIAVPLALTGALVYSLMAGFDLPVQRAFAMSTTALLALTLRRSNHIWHVLGLAFLFVAAIDPMAGLSSGFWLSFSAVIGLVCWYSFRPSGGALHQLLSAQVVVFVCLAPALAFFQGNVSPWSMPVNLIAIPWVSLSIVPCCLLGTLCQFFPSVSDFFLSLAIVQVEWLLNSLTWITLNTSRTGGLPLISLPSGNFALLACLLLIATLFLLPRGFPRLVPISVIVIALAMYQPDADVALELSILDVGQGMGMVVRAGDKVLVYDTGPGSATGFNAGEAVVVPYLNSLEITSIDVLVISHSDSDHAGGVSGLLMNKPVGAVYAGQPHTVPAKDVMYCRRGIDWFWHGARFSFIWPLEGNGYHIGSGGDNDRSCVLLVEKGGVRILIPGDIEASAERYLSEIDQDYKLADATVLVAPHHGSKTSSSEVFLQHVKPRHVVFSAGFNHHFGHPHPDVLTRYRELGTEIWHTAYSGALVFSWDEKERLSLYSHREHYRHYWN